MEPTSITIDRMQNGKYRFTGQTALGFANPSQSLSLTIEQIAQIVILYNAQVFSVMHDNRQQQKTVSAEHHDVVHLKEHEKRVPSPPSSEAETSDDEKPEKPRKKGKKSKDDAKPDDDGAAAAAPAKKNQLWHSYVKLVKSENPLLSHADAVTLAKSTYQDWKAQQA